MFTVVLLALASLVSIAVTNSMRLTSLARINFAKGSPVLKQNLARPWLGLGQIASVNWVKAEGKDYLCTV